MASESLVTARGKATGCLPRLLVGLLAKTAVR